MIKIEDVFFLLASIYLGYHLIVILKNEIIGARELLEGRSFKWHRK